MTALRELVGAWRTQTDRTSAAFTTMNDGIRRELDAVGGYATTSPDKGGCCRTFWWIENERSFSSGAVEIGESRHGEAAPTHPEVGDRCSTLEQAWRKEVMALTESVLAIQKHVGRGDRYSDQTVLIACVASKLVDDEVSDRAAIVEWLRSDRHHLSKEQRDALIAAANSIERGGHLRQ